MNGYVLLHRSIYDCDFFDRAEPLCEQMAWIDLLMLANYHDSEMSIRGIKFQIKRGQLGWSVVSLSERWNWSRKKVQNFLDRLEQANMVCQEVLPSDIHKKGAAKSENLEQQKEQQIGTAKKSPLTTIITITNYEQYQSKRAAKRDSKKSSKIPQNGAHPKEDLDLNKIPSPAFADFWTAYKVECKQKGSKLYAEKCWDKLGPEEKEKAIRSLEEFVPYWTGGNGHYPPHASTFLNGKRWEALEEKTLFTNLEKTKICPDCGGNGCEKCNFKRRVRADAITA